MDLIQRVNEHFIESIAAKQQAMEVLSPGIAEQVPLNDLPSGALKLQLSLAALLAQAFTASCGGAGG